jgi:hypothetical protein
VGGQRATEECVAVLNRAAPLIWNRLRHETDLRNVPKLRFSGDFTGEYSDQVFKTLEELKDRGELVLGEDEVEGEKDTEDDRRGGAQPPPAPIDEPQHSGGRQGGPPTTDSEDETSAG